MITIAWSGHRPGEFDASVTNYPAFCKALDALGVGARKDIQFVVGGALGVDQWAAEYAISRGIPFRVILPFQIAVMTSKWPVAARARLIAQCNKAQSVEHLSLTYDVRSYQDRNVRMVDEADYVFTVYTGKRGGGTYNCLRYALSEGKPVFNLFPLNGRLRPIKEIA